MKLTIGSSEYEAKEGETILDVCDRLGITEIESNCRSAVCSTCMVEVSSGIENLSPANDDEKGILEEFEEPSYRLSCQAKISGPVSISPLEED